MATTSAAVRLPRVEAFLGGAIDRSLSGEAIERLVAERVVEFEQLDFKREMYQSDPDGRAELAKDVVAFANHTGGLLICGVADVKGTASKAMPWAASDADVRHVHAVLAAHCSPLPHVEAFVVPAASSSEGYLLIAVASSPWAPHAVSGGEALSFPVRNGSATRYLRQPELADRYRNRFESAASQISHLDRVIGEAVQECTAMRPGPTWRSFPTCSDTGRSPPQQGPRRRAGCSRMRGVAPSAETSSLRPARSASDA